MLFLLPLTGLALGAFARTAYVFPDDKGKKENVSIRIEGANFYSSDGKSGKPLFVVDGLEVASIDTLSPDRIASVTVLKDASAEALYGEKGRNGVVVVSTKDAAGGARDYSVDAEDGSVKVVVRGSGKMSDVRVSGSSTVPADKAGIDAGAKTRGHVVSVTGSDGKKTVVSQSRVTVTDDGGVTVMKTALGMDTGDMLLSLKTEIGAEETYGELSERLSLLGAEAIVKALPLIESGNYTLVKQDEGKAFAVRKIDKEQAKIDFSLPAKKIVDLVRGMNPEPKAFAEIEGGKLNVYRAEIAARPAGTEGSKVGEILSDSPKQGFLVACGDGAVKLTEVQAAGGKRMKGSDFLSGRKVKKGQVFSC